MKKVLIFAFAFMLSIGVWAQHNESYTEVMRSALKTEKKAMVADAMTFSAEESTAFWPVYNAYQEKLYTANSKYLKIIQDFANNFDAMSNDRAMDIMKRMNAYDNEILKLKKTYMKKFSKILSPAKVLRYFQIENKIDVLIDFQISTEVPLLEVE